MKNTFKYRAIFACAVCLSLLASGCTQGSPPMSQSGSTYPRPQDDLYESVNGEWLITAEIPAEKMSVGGFDDIANRIEHQLMRDFAEMPEEISSNFGTLSEFLKFYDMALDYESRNTEGAKPLQPHLERIEAIQNISDFNNELPELILTGMSLPQVAAPISLSVQADWMHVERNALYIDMPALILPDVSYYDSPMGEKLLVSYEDILQRLLIMSGCTQDKATLIAEQTIAFDQLLKSYSKTALEQADITNFYNPWSIDKLFACSTSIDFDQLLTSLVPETPTNVIVTNEQFFLELDNVINEENLSLLKGWLYGQTVFSAATALSEEMLATAGEYNLLLTGKSSLEDVQTLAYRLVSEPYKDLIGVYYGQTYFGAEARNRVTKMTEDIRSVYISRMQRNNWLSDETKEAAIKKLVSMKVHIGYPENISPVYDQLLVSESTVFSQYLSFNRLHVTSNLDKAGKATDSNEWIMSAHVVNAINHLMSNTIYFPAAILQEPFFSLDYSESRNYGAIGAVIAHEITHAFDTNGAKFDQHGNMRNWWAESDYAAFQKRADAMIMLFDGLPFAGGNVNGYLTATENISDAGGLSCALEIVEKLPNSDMRDFFGGWAAIWRLKATPELENILLELDTHAPYKLRTNVQAQLLDSFYKTYDVKEGDGMYLAPDQRISVW